MQPGKIYLIRHGQTEGNGHHYVGWEDLSLNENGINQAQAISNLLRVHPIATIYCSTLRRAIDTALPLSKQKQLKLETDKALNEIDYGAYQGRLKSELELKLRKDYRYRPLPDGESLYDVYLRVKQFRESIARLLAMKQDLAIFSHYWSIRLFLGILHNKSFDDIFAPGGYKPTNGSVYEVQYECNSVGNLDCLSERYLETQSEYEKIATTSEVLL